MKPALRHVEGPLFLSLLLAAGSSAIAADRVDLESYVPQASAAKQAAGTGTGQITAQAFLDLNDAHYFGNVVFNMYRDWLSLRPISQTLYMKAHYGNSYENAFWDGSGVSLVANYQ